MARRAFYSFHYKPDNWRAGQVRNMGVVDGNRPCSDNDWESVTKGGDAAIRRWIADQMEGKSCVVVLIGASTAGRKWINHEIVEGWNAKKGVVGIYVHGLQDSNGDCCGQGANPFAEIRFDGTRQLSSIVRAYNPSGSTSKLVYADINANLATWVDEAVTIRNRYG